MQLTLLLLVLPIYSLIMNKRGASPPRDASRPTSPKQVRFAPDNLAERPTSDSEVHASDSEMGGSESELGVSESETCISETEASSDGEVGSGVNLANLSENEDDIPLVVFAAHEPLPKYVPFQENDSSDEEEPHLPQETGDALGPLDMSKDPGEQIRKQILHVKNSTHCSDNACDGFIKIIHNITEQTDLKGCMSRCYKSVRSTSLGNLPKVTMRYTILDKEKQAIKEEKNQASFPYSMYGDKKKFKVLAKFYDIPLTEIWKFHSGLSEDHDPGCLLSRRVIYEFTYF